MILENRKIPLQMDSVDNNTIAPNKSKGGRMARTISKVFSIRSLSGIGSDNAAVHKIKPENLKNNNNNHLLKNTQVDFEDEDNEKLRNRAAIEVFLARLFASVSAFKAAYSQLQFAQSPYDPDGIQSADEMVISELKILSELKQCFLKKQLVESSPETSILSAEIKEQKSLIKTYQVMEKKLDSDLKLKDSELTFLKEKLEEANKENKLLEKRMNSSGQLSMADNIRLSSLSPRHFVSHLRQATKSIRSFVRLLISEMESAEWDLDAAAESIEPGVHYWKSSHKCYTFESFVCREMFDGFNHPEFSFSSKSFSEKDQKQLFFDRFMELKSLNAMDYLAWKPKSTFSRFCRAKYLTLIHPKMESSFFGNLDQRNLVNAGEFLETTFFVTFAEMAKRVWLLHCLGFSFAQEVSSFQVKGCRFSEVYMESVNEEGLISSNTVPRVAFTVVPGFRLSKTVVQCQVYMCC